MSDQSGELTVVFIRWIRIHSRTILVALALLVSLVSATTLLGFERQTIATSIVADGDHLYRFALPRSVLLEAISDSNQSPEDSSLVLLENGVPLRYPHQLHKAIASIGGGRYSHWGKYVIFSTSDNTSPLVNGRRYEARYKLVPNPLITKGLWALLAIAAVLSCGPSQRQRFAAVLGKAGTWKALGWGGIATIAVALAATAALPEPARRPLANGLHDAILYLQGVVALSGLFLLSIAMDWAPNRRRLTGILDVGLRLTLLAAIASWLRHSVSPAFISTKWMVLSGETLSIAAGLLLGLTAAIWPYATVGRWVTDLRRCLTDVCGDPSRLRGAIGAAAILTGLTILPPVVQYWDNSGWMDSQGYDSIAHLISVGAAPFGESYYMPVYQYGMAAIYYVFGHFFFIQQIFNIVLAMAGTAFFCMAAWNIFRNIGAVLIVGIWCAFTSQMHHATWYTQIEGWYIPFFGLALFAATSYLRAPRLRMALFLGVCIALLFNTRSQGFFLFCALTLTPLWVRASGWRQRILHVTAIAAVIVVATLPWMTRNYVVEHNFSPSSNQSAIQLAVLNDPRIGLYGILYNKEYTAVHKDWIRRYPDVTERTKAMRAYFVHRLTTEPGWFAQAFPWRLLSFYGLLPPGVWAADGPQDTDWATAWPGYVAVNFATLVLWGLTLIVPMRRPRARLTYYLLGLIVSNLAVCLLVGQGEARPSYPILPVHMVLALTLAFSPRLEFAECGWRGLAGRPREWLGPIWSWRTPVVAAAVLAVCHLAIGRHFLYRPLMDSTIALDPSLSLDDGGLELWQVTQEQGKPAALRAVRARLTITDYMLPPRYVQQLPYFPPSVQGDDAPIYYYGWVVEEEGHPLPSFFRTNKVAVYFRDAKANRLPREGDTVEVEGDVVAYRDPAIDPIGDSPGVWLHLRKILVLN